MESFRNFPHYKMIYNWQAQIYWKKDSHGILKYNNKFLDK